MRDLADRLDARLVGDPEIVISGLGSLESAQAGQITHLSSGAYKKFLSASRASAVILSSEDLRSWGGNALVVANPYVSFARVSQLFAAQTTLPHGQHPSAVVAPDAQVAPSAGIGPGVVIGARTRIAPGASVHANCVIGEDCVLSEAVTLLPGVVLYDDVHIGARSLVHSGAVLGADGFGYAADAGGQLVSIAQLGGVRIAEDVSIGAASTIDRGAIDHTIIGSGVKIDNQVQIGHNCRIGDYSVICGCVGIVGSTRIGRHCVLAGGVGVGGDGPIEICDHVTVTGMTHVSASISEPGNYSGGVLHSRSRRWKRNVLRFRDLDNLYRRVAGLEKRLEQYSEADPKHPDDCPDGDTRGQTGR